MPITTIVAPRGAGLRRALVAFALLAGHAAYAGSVLVSTRGTGELVVLSDADLKELARFQVGIGAHELATTPDGLRAVGSAYGSGPKHMTPDQRLFVLDVPGRDMLRAIDLGPEHQRPNDLAFLPDARHVLATSEVHRSVIKVDTQDGTILQTIHHGEPGGHMLALSPDALRCYVSTVPAGVIAVIDVARGEVIGKVTTQPGAEGMAISPDGRWLWVACNRSQSIAVIDAASLKVAHTIATDGFPFRVRFTPDGSKVLISHPASGDVRIYDPGTREVLAKVALGGPNVQTAPTSLAVSGDSTCAWAVCAARGAVAKIDLRELRLVSELVVGLEADGLVWSAHPPG